VEFVRGQRYGIGPGLGKRNLAEGLDHVAMEQDAVFAAKLGDRPDGLDDAGLVVRGQDGRQRGVRAERRL